MPKNLDIHELPADILCTISEDGADAALCFDARKAVNLLVDESIDAIITSPPYGDLKNYGTQGELGYGQDLETEYFQDIRNLFKKLLSKCKYGGALWLVIDEYSRGRKKIMLPFEFLKLMEEVGWTYQASFFWDKGKSLPWSGPGKLRSVCEHILLFSKGKSLKTFDIDAIRSTEDLSKYWVKYPERFHPAGKAPTNLWHIPIPSQGAWSNGKQPRHLCPFPVKLSSRMIALTTNKGETVLDPFFGSGSVIASASAMGRKSIGFEMNRDLFLQYKTGGRRALQKELLEKSARNKNKIDRSIYSTIMALRVQKYAKSLCQKLSKAPDIEVTYNKIVVGIILSNYFVHSGSALRRSGKYGACEFLLLTEGSAKRNANLLRIVNEIIKEAPLSLYGIEAKVRLVPKSEWIDKRLEEFANRKMFYAYTRGVFYKSPIKLNHSEQISDIVKRFQSEKKGYPVIISPKSVNMMFD